MKAFVRTVLGALAFATSTHADVIFSDSEFNNSDWELITYANDNGDGTRAVHSNSGGNPGTYRSISMSDVAGGRGLYFVFHRRVGDVYSPASQGAIDHIDYSESNYIFIGSGASHTTGPALRQNDRLYFHPFAIVRDGHEWGLTGATGLRATNFAYFDAASTNAPDFSDNTQHPDFTTNGAPIEVGFFRAKMAAPDLGEGYLRAIRGGIDNWSLAIRLAGDPNYFEPSGVAQIAQQAYLKASNTGASNQFGGPVAISGDTLVAGAIMEDSDARGVNGLQTSNSVPYSGAAYVFVRNGTNWTQQAYLKASNARANSYFGAGLAISGDTIIVGAYGEDGGAGGVNGDQSETNAFESGAAYIFVRQGTNWIQQAYLKASNPGKGIPYRGDLFGYSVALSGNIAVVSAPLEGSNDTGVNGNQTDNTAYGAGAAYVFVRDGTNWTQEAYLKASNTGAGDQFGYSVALSGETLVVGANEEGSSAVGVNGEQTNNSAPTSGAAYVFVRTGTNWAQQAYLKASNTGSGDEFGNVVHISGETIVVGAPQEDSNATGINGNQSNNSATTSGAAYIFVRNGTNWSQEAYLKASNTGGDDEFGVSAGISGDVVVVATGGEGSNATGINGNQTNNTVYGAGAAYVFVRNGTNWTQQAYLKASNTGVNDIFGDSAAVSGGTVVVGAPGEDSDATGVNGDQTNNSATDSGAAYVFTGLGPSAPELAIEQFVGIVRIFWPLAASDFVLDEADVLNASPTAVWTQVPFPYQTNATDVSITLPQTAGNKFYRLRKP